MNNKKLHFSLSDKLNPADTENQTFGCRANNPEICAFCYLEGVCAFTTADNICRKPSRKWKKYFSQLKEGDNA